MDNRAIAERLAAYARALEGDEGNIYRIRAYRRAAETILRLDQPVADLVAQCGRKGLQELPGIGSHLACTIDRLVRTGQFRTMTPEAVVPGQRLRALPGIGPALSELLDERLGVTTIPELETAAADGRLDQLGLPPWRVRKLREALAQRQTAGRPPDSPAEEPPVAELLAIDAEYRQQAEEGRLATIAPRRFNPEHEAWLPLYHTHRGGLRYRALFSNTALAHRLGQTRDWVVIYFDGERFSGQRTVVTQTQGDLHGRRVVRGREAECRAYYHEPKRAG
jgi:hypothetical protein